MTKNSIAIIICSRKGKLDAAFKRNMSNTVGCLHEIIVIDNSENKYSIAEAYNIGISKSNSEIVCFLHEDILIHTQCWGISLLEMFHSNPKYGLIGIAGSRIKTKIPSGWWDCDKNDKIVNIIQHLPSGKVEKQYMGFVNNPIEEAAVVDGVFFGLRNIDKIKFNEDLKDFHGYDLNISFEVLKNGLKVAITNLILLEHYSIGELNIEWLKATVKVHDLYSNILPLNLNNGNLKKAEINNCIQLINISRKLKSNKHFFRYWQKLIWLDPLNKMHFLLFKKLFLKTIK